MLTEQYRMHKNISAFTSRTFYGNKLKTAACLTATRTCTHPCVWIDCTTDELKHEFKVSLRVHVSSMHAVCVAKVLIAVSCAYIHVHVQAIADVSSVMLALPATNGS